MFDPATSNHLVGSTKKFSSIVSQLFQHRPVAGVGTQIHLPDLLAQK